MADSVKVLDMSGEAGEDADLPSVFSTPLRPDIVQRAWWILHSHAIQPYGRDPMAGERTSAETSNPPTGRGISRIPRVKGAGNQRSGQAGGVASTVKGRLPHPPRSEKVIYRKINVKEKKLALNTAIAFTGNASAVSWRGHKVGKLKFPLVVSDELEALEKTAAVEAFLSDLGLGEELKRIYGGVKRRSGKPRMRGRTTKKKVGPLIVVSNDRGIGKAAASIPGVEVAAVDSLSVLPLAPGGVAGRLTIWTKSAVELLSSKEKEAMKVEA
ncbi:MAG TPA: 50S ribosomal protein L4 [Nitrososphaerales archaeon]|nr:50S ribosomal protein L4 [Nitrososphaerales archaeon]